MVDKTKITEAAERYVMADKLEAAIAEYEKLLDGGAQDIPIGNMIGDLYIRLRQPEKAIKIFQKNADYLEKRGAYAQVLAIVRKINKLDPSDIGVIVRLGDLYSRLGFVPEARTEYSKAARELEAGDDLESLMHLYEKLAKLDREDLVSRLKLARLYFKKGQAEKAASEFNDIADILFVREDDKEAEKVLLEAQELCEDDIRTLSSIARLFSRERRHEEAVSLVKKTIEKHGRLPEFLRLLGDIYLDGHKDQLALEIFRDLLAEDSKDADARAKLGYLEARNGRPDRAYELFEPLIASLLSRNKADKAIGLLGLIVMSGTMHLPSLEKLAFIYKLKGQKKNLGTVDRILLGEYRKNAMEEKKAAVLKELTDLFPRDAEVEREIKSSRKDLRTALEEMIPEETPSLTEKERDLMLASLAKVDLYLQEGLVRNALRILENLRIMYPDEPKIEQILALVKKIPLPQVDEAEIPDIVEYVASKEAKAEGKEPGEKK
jgi:tetratricopeptide (TPR) repeat protein